MSKKKRGFGQKLIFFDNKEVLFKLWSEVWAGSYLVWTSFLILIKEHYLAVRPVGMFLQSVLEI